MNGIALCSQFIANSSKVYIIRFHFFLSFSVFVLIVNL